MSLTWSATPSFGDQPTFAYYPASDAPYKAPSNVPTMASGSGSKNMETAQLFARFFGPPNVPVNPDVWEKYGKHNWATPDGYKGPLEFVRALVQDFVGESYNVYTDWLLPFQECPNNHTTWMGVDFAPSLLAEEPAYTAPELLMAKMWKRESFASRYGLGFQLEHGFMKTPQGQEMYRGYLVSLKTAIVAFYAIRVMTTILHSHDYKTQFNLRVGSPIIVRNLRPNVLNWLQQQYTEFSGFQKVDDFWNVITTQYVKTMKQASVNADTVIIPTQVQMYLGTVIERRPVDMVVVGPSATPDSLARRKYDFKLTNNGLKIVVHDPITWKADTPAMDCLQRSRCIGDVAFMLNHLEGIQGNMEHYSSRQRSIFLYDEERDEMVEKDLQAAQDAARRFTASGDLSVVHKKVADNLNESGKRMATAASHSSSHMEMDEDAGEIKMARHGRNQTAMSDDKSDPFDDKSNVRDALHPDMFLYLHRASKQQPETKYNGAPEEGKFAVARFIGEQELAHLPQETVARMARSLIPRLGLNDQWLANFREGMDMLKQMARYSMKDDMVLIVQMLQLKDCVKTVAADDMCTVDPAAEAVYPAQFCSWKGLIKLSGATSKHLKKGAQIATKMVAAVRTLCESLAGIFPDAAFGNHEYEKKYTKYAHTGSESDSELRTEAIFNSIIRPPCKWLSIRDLSGCDDEDCTEHAPAEFGSATDAKAEYDKLTKSKTLSELLTSSGRVLERRQQLASSSLSQASVARSSMQLDQSHTEPELSTEEKEKLTALQKRGLSQPATSSSFSSSSSSMFTSPSFFSGFGDVPHIPQKLVGEASTVTQFWSFPVEALQLTFNRDAFPEETTKRTPATLPSGGSDALFFTRNMRRRLHLTEGVSDDLLRVVMHYIASCPIKKAFFDACIARDVFYYPQFILPRPWEQYMTESIVFMKAGSDTGASLWGDSDFQFLDNGSTKFHLAHYTVNIDCIIVREKNIMVARDVYVSGYVRGAGTTFFTHADQYQPATGMHTADMFSFMVSSTDKDFPNPMDLTGHYQPDYLVDLNMVRELAKFDRLHYSSAEYYNTIWDFRSIKQSSSCCAAFDDDNWRQNTLLWKTHQAVFRPTFEGAGDFTTIHRNTSPIGPLYRGCKAVHMGGLLRHPPEELRAR